MNKVGVCEWCLPVEGPFSLDFAADTGFDGIQLGDLGGSQKGFPMTNAFIREGYKEAATRTGIYMHSMHLHTLVREAGHIYPMNSPKGETANLSIRNGIDSCEAMGIPCLNISAFFQSYVRDDYDLQNLIDHLNYACGYGKDHGIYVVYEPGVTLDLIQVILDKVPGLTLNYDLLNPKYSGRGEPLEELAALGSAVIDHVHIKDCKRDTAGRFASSCFAGEGAGMLRESIHLLKRQGYDKWYLSESGYLDPLAYGIGPDISLVCTTDCHAIRKLLQEA